VEFCVSSTRTTSESLAERKLENEDRESNDEEGNEIRDEKGAATVRLCQVGKTPDVAKADGKCDICAHELELIRPLFTTSPANDDVIF
jgi:hypothetical protein